MIDIIEAKIRARAPRGISVTFDWDINYDGDEYTARIECHFEAINRFESADYHDAIEEFEPYIEKVFDWANEQDDDYAYRIYSIDAVDDYYD